MLVRSRRLGDVYKRQMLGCDNELRVACERKKSINTVIEKREPAKLKANPVPPELAFTKPALKGAVAPKNAAPELLVIDVAAVSYTHLTLPASDLGKI